MSKSSMQIWKLQRPLYTNNSYNAILAYTEDRTEEHIIEIDENEIKSLFGDYDKIYIRGFVNSETLMIINHVSQQPW